VTNIHTASQRDRQLLEWADVEAAATLALDIWVGQPELRWAREAWQHLSNADLAQYDNELGRCTAAMRFAALCCIYLDFCAAAYEACDGASIDAVCFSEWALALKVPAFRLGQMIGNDDNFPSDPDDSEGDDLLDRAVKHLAERERKTLVKALKAGYGGDGPMFLALVRSKNFAEEPDSEDDDYEEPLTDEEIYANMSSEEVRAFDWIAAGCYPWA
jgi:hypothetical protein